MTINEGTWDRVVRLVIGVTLAYVAWSTWPSGESFLSATSVVSFVSLVIGMIALVTGVIGWCALYETFRISTNKRVTA